MLFTMLAITELHYAYSVFLAAKKTPV